jgi:hypothetical protein
LSLESFDTTVMHLTTRWQHADKEFLRHLFPLLAQGTPVAPTYLSEVTGKDLAEVDQALIRGRTTRDNNGNVVELFGISQTAAHHRIRMGNVSLYSCCALVAQMLPLLLGKSVTIESLDPIDNRLIKLEVSPDGLESVAPDYAVGTLVITDQEQVLSNVASAFCSHVHLFSDAMSAQEFANLDPRRYMVNIVQFHQAAQKLYAAVWG